MQVCPSPRIITNIIVKEEYSNAINEFLNLESNKHMDQYYVD